MHRYCLDTSGLSNPVIDLPSHIYVSLWPLIISKINAHWFCWNVEISNELNSIRGPVGEALKNCHNACCYEVGADGWDWESYLQIVDQWRITYKEYISEYNGNRKNTISLNDLSIVAFAKIVGLPILSMERRTSEASRKRLKIPDLCDREDVRHFSFNEFLEVEGLTI